MASPGRNMPCTPGTAARLFRSLAEAGINIEDMQNIVFSGGAAACARIGMVGALPDAALARLAEHDAIFSLSQVQVNA